MAGIDDRRHESERFDLGMAERRATLGAAHVAAAQSASGFSADFQEMITRYSWGEVWSRPGLDRTSRRLVTIAMLIAMNRPDDLEAHIRAALRDGTPIDSIREVFMHAAIYCGLPAADHAFRLAESVLSGSPNGDQPHREERR